jgi:hypothetical protein
MAFWPVAEATEVAVTAVVIRIQIIQVLSFNKFKSMIGHTFEDH